MSDSRLTSAKIKINIFAQTYNAFNVDIFYRYTGNFMYIFILIK